MISQLCFRYVYLKLKCFDFFCNVLILGFIKDCFWCLLSLLEIPIVFLKVKSRTSRTPSRGLLWSRPNDPPPAHNSFLNDGFLEDLDIS